MLSVIAGGMSVLNHVSTTTRMSSELSLMTSRMSGALLTADRTFSDPIRTQLLTAAGPGWARFRLAVEGRPQTSSWAIKVAAGSVDPVDDGVRVTTDAVQAVGNNHRLPM